MTHLCSLCSYSTNKRYNLNRHISTVHKVLDVGKEEAAENNQTLSENNQTLSENNQTLSDNNQSMSENNQTLSKNNQSLDVETIDGRKPHACPTCYKSYTRKVTLNAHILKCKKVQSALECDKCHRVFNTQSTLAMHRRRCDGPETSPSNDAGSSTSSTSMVQNIQNTNVSNSHNITTNSNNTVTNNIAGDVNYINNFGFENKEYIAIEFIRQCLNQGSYGISPMIDKIYFDPEHPENHNVSLESFKNRLVKVVQEKQWQFTSLLNTIDAMISKASNFILTSLSKEILEQVASTAAGHAEETMANVQSIQNLEPQVKKRIREHTKGRLARRRDNSTKQIAPT